MRCCSWKAMYTSITILDLLIHLFNSYTFWDAITENFDVATVCLRVSQCFTVKICSRDNTFAWIKSLIFRILVNIYFQSTSVFIFIIIILSRKIYLYGHFVEFQYYQYYFLRFHRHHYYFHKTIYFHFQFQNDQVK